jgi:hypothetical protein
MEPTNRALGISQRTVDYGLKLLLKNKIPNLCFSSPVLVSLKRLVCPVAPIR